MTTNLLSEIGLHILDAILIRSVDCLGATNADVPTAASTAIENGGPFHKKSSNKKYQRRRIPQSRGSSGPDVRRIQPGASIYRFPQHLRSGERDYQFALPEIADLIRETRAREKKKLPYGKLATFGSHRSKGGSLRNNANMISIDGIEADYDAGKMSVDEACRKLREAGLAALLWTTPSHTPEAPRYRILCSTSKELPVSERKALVARLNGVLGGVLDGASFTDSQAMSFGHLIEEEASE